MFQGINYAQTKMVKCMDRVWHWSEICFYIVYGHENDSQRQPWMNTVENGNTAWKNLDVLGKFYVNMVIEDQKTFIRSPKRQWWVTQTSR